MRPTPLVTAATATIFFVGTLGLLLVVAGFGVIDLCDNMLEALGFLSPRWGQGHPVALVEIAAIVSAPAVIWLGIWFFRKAQAAEARLQQSEAAAK